jgi:hypothetical protein
MVFPLSWLLPSNGWIQLYENGCMHDMKLHTELVRNIGFSGVSIGTGGM